MSMAGVRSVRRLLRGRPVPSASSPATTGEQSEPAALMLDVDLVEPMPGIAGYDEFGIRRPRACVLAREEGRPVALLFLDVPENGLSSAALLLAVRAQAGSPAPVGGSVSRPAHGSPTEPPDVTVALCSRERPEGLRRALESLVRQTYRPFRVVVVDNAPATDVTRKVVDEFAPVLAVDYVPEPRKGLSRARNAALTVIPGGVIAWMDDDEEADPAWVAELVRGFAEHPEASAVSGVVIPAELRTREQLWFEQFGGHSKGRGFSSQVLSGDMPGGQSPLFPLPPFGAGANMAFRAEALQAIGGFDEALGAGTRTGAGEDTKVFTQLLLAGGSVVYWPAALTRHYHRSDLAGLEAQLRAYGSGLTAFYTAMILDDARNLLRLLVLAPTAARALFGRNSLRTATIGHDFPAYLLGLNKRAMLAGPFLYVRERLARRGGRERGAD